ncbi:unnamed protein product [Haemonchus placei]|uniref:Uncharacterized protein n=1 Tax=Haemonchus placei TaxID=6290 RepID=A0A0N4WD24_HAEPC|nr:unnamed protein product [Haemonchus placei]
MQSGETVFLYLCFILKVRIGLSVKGRGVSVAPHGTVRSFPEEYS